MLFLVIRHDHPNAQSLRDALKQNHRAFLSSLGKRLITGGAIFNNNGAVIGGSITFEAQDLEEAHKIANSDPYSQHPDFCLNSKVYPFRARWKDGVFYDGNGYSTAVNPLLPVFQTKRLLLTGIKLEDVASYQKHFVDYDVIRYLSAYVPWPYPENGVADFFTRILLPRQGIDRWTWAIRLKDDSEEVIGCVDLWREGKPENRGFWLGRKFWGQGYMTEAIEPVMDYALNSLGFEKLIFTNAVGNERSRRVKEKTGAHLVGIKPASFVDPKFTEHEIWELKKDAWMAFKDRG